MGILRHLQHWLSGQGPQLQTAEFVPETHPIRLWADTFPWDAMIDAVTQSVAQRFPKKRAKGGRVPIPPRVLLALELLKHELGESDEGICQRCRADVAVMYACGLREVQADGAQAHLLVDTFPSEQGSQRVTDATTLYKAQKKPFISSRASASSAPDPPRP